ncbi:MAG: hypothetical protein JSV09_09460 [Thermoplasmata archaeon]|nr:MAG: hypothetical protein JSV09_09460 [Thermoplasmata archaeon]
MKDEQELGELIFDSSPNNLKLLIYGIISAVIGVSLILYGSIFEQDIILFFGLITVIFLSSFFFASVSSNEKFRFRIFQGGLIINSEKYSKDPVKNPYGIRVVGKRHIKYEDIKSIHPYVFKFRKNPHFNSIGLLFVLQKEKDKYIAGKILVTGKKIITMPEIITMLKSQMGSLWEHKYKRDEPIWSGRIESDRVPLIVEFGENP